MYAMTRFERCQAALQGQPVDRVPTSFWGHQFLREWSADDLAQAMLEFQRKYDWDYMKINPRAVYYAEDWGSKFKPSGTAYDPPVVEDYPIKHADDWKNLKVLDPTQGVFGEHVSVVRLIVDTLKWEVVPLMPIVQTVFSPLSVTTHLLGGDEKTVKTYMKNAPEVLHEGLKVISQTVADYARACVEAGAAGIYFATTGYATRDLLTEDEYKEFGIPYDLKVLEAVQENATFNILHICRANNMFDLLKDYPVHIISWAATLPGNPSLKEGLAKTSRAVMGGISEKTTLLEGTPEQVKAEVAQALEETEGLRLFMAPGCSISPRTPEANLLAAKEAVVESA